MFWGVCYKNIVVVLFWIDNFILECKVGVFNIFRGFEGKEVIVSFYKYRWVLNVVCVIE